MRRRQERSTLLATALLMLPGCLEVNEPQTSATESGSTSTTSTTIVTFSDSHGESSSASTSDPTGQTSTSTTDESEGGSTTMTSTSTTTGAPPVCGDEIVGNGEECDLGLANTNDGLCTTHCLMAACGDGFLQEVIGEQCDHGAEINNNSSGCLENCIKATCGDGHTWLDVEECDDGEMNQAGIYDGCDPLSCTKGPHCGDNIVQKPEEECDLGVDNGEESGPCSTACTLAGNMVFATSASFSGKIGAGGVEAANAACAQAAANAKIANAGSFRAWLSDDTHSPATWNPKPQGPFILPNTTIIAHSWPGLVDGLLLAPIDVLETGEPIVEKPFFAWTGSEPDGTPAAETERCSEWSTTSKPHSGLRGRLTDIGDGWTKHSTTECQKLARLICIEQ